MRRRSCSRAGPDSAWTQACRYGQPLGPWLASSAEQSFAQDFRGNEGFWKEYPPMAKARLTFSQCADPRHFKTDPAFAYDCLAGFLSRLSGFATFPLIGGAFTGTVCAFIKRRAPVLTSLL